MEPLVIAIGGVVLIVLAEEGRRIVLALLRHRTARQVREHQTRRIESLVLFHAAQQTDTSDDNDSMPDWLERQDPAEVDIEAWERATAEILKITERLL